MDIRVIGSNIEIGEALTQYVEENLAKSVKKYFEKAVNAVVHFSKSNQTFKVVITVNEGVKGGINVKSDAEAGDVYGCFNEAAERYGLAIAYMRKNEFVKARHEVEWLKGNTKKSAIIETLAAKLEVVTNQPDQALNQYMKALNIYPNYRGLIYGLAEHYLMRNQPEKTVSLINEKLNLYPDDSYLYELLSKAYAKEGKELLQYQAQSESYYRKFNLQQAIQQMELAAKSKDGNFYQKSIVESRLKQLTFEYANDRSKDKK